MTILKLGAFGCFREEKYLFFLIKQVQIVIIISERDSINRKNVSVSRYTYSLMKKFSNRWQIR